jgi:hypothetical protein
MLINQDIHVVPIESVNIEELRSYLLSSNSIEDYANQILINLIAYNVPITQSLECRGWSIEKYTPQNNNVLVCDDTKDRQSIVSCKLFLTDGGLVNFVNHNTQYAPSEGDVLIYPSNYINTYSMSDIPEEGLIALCGYFKYRQTEEG